MFVPSASQYRTFNQNVLDCQWASSSLSLSSSYMYTIILAQSDSRNHNGFAQPDKYVHTGQANFCLALRQPLVPITANIIFCRLHKMSIGHYKMVDDVGGLSNVVFNSSLCYAATQ